MKISYSWPLQPFTLQTITFAQYPVSNKASYVLERTLTRKRFTHRERPSQSTHRNRTSHPRDDHPPLGTTFWGVFWLPSSLVLTHALTTLRAHTYIHANTYIHSYVRKAGWEVRVCEMVRRLGVAGVSSPLQWSPGQTVRSIEGRGYTFLGGGHPALSAAPRICRRRRSCRPSDIAAFPRALVSRFSRRYHFYFASWNIVRKLVASFENTLSNDIFL